MLQRIKADKVKVRILLSLLRKLLLAIQNSVLCLTQTKDSFTNTFPVITPKAVQYYCLKKLEIVSLNTLNTKQSI